MLVFCYERDYSQIQAAEMLRDSGWPDDRHMERMLADQTMLNAERERIESVLAEYEDDYDEYDDEGFIEDDNLPDVDDRTYDD